MAVAKTNQFKSSELHLITFLRLNNLRPVRRTVDEEERAALYYEKTADLEECLVRYMDKCSICGFAWSEVGPAFAQAKAMLLDGDLGNGRMGNRKGGRR